MNNPIETTSTFNDHIKPSTSEKFTLDISSMMDTNYTSLADDNISLADNTASLIDISLNKSSNEPQTSITAAKDKGIESQMKKLFDLHEQTYDHAMIMYQKQEKMEKMISQLSLQIKDISSKLDNVEGKKKLDWWEVCTIHL